MADNQNKLDELLSDEALDFARRHLTKYYDTDFFPKPFEFNAIWFKWDELKAMPRKEIIKQSPPICISWRKARGGYRVVHQMHPLDVIVYTAMTYSIAREIEKKRKENNSYAVCSYRIHLDGSGFFANGSGFETYRNRCGQLAEDFGYVLMTDISDFYNQIYLHRLENAISEATNSRKGKVFEKFLMALNTKNSQGLPVGPAASIILSEAALIDVDDFISNEGFKHARYVDDIRVFANSELELDLLLQKLTVYLHHSHRLGLVSEKTKIIDSSSFLQLELNNQYQLEKLDILETIESGNHYGYNEEEGDENEEDTEEQDDEVIGEKLLNAIERIKKYEHLDLGLARAILRRGRVGRHKELIDFVLDNLKQFRPVINDIALYLEAVTDEDTIVAIQRRLRQLLIDKQLADESSIEWLSWYIGNHLQLSRDTDLRAILDDNKRCSYKARAVVKAKNISWVRQNKVHLLNAGDWNRRAIIYASQILSNDEKETWLSSIKHHPNLDLLDKWIIEWVLAGTPDSDPLPEPPIELESLSFSINDLDDDIPF